MKTSATLLTLMAGVGFALGQGTIINFNNLGVTVGGDHKVYFGSVGNAPGVTGTNYWAELFYVDPATSALTPWAPSISRFRVSSTSAPGTWSGKTVTLPAGTPLIGGSILLDVVVWDTVLNPSQDLVNGAGLIGRSGLFIYTWHDSSPNPPQPSDTQMVTMPAIGFTAIPEPSIIALAVFGVSGLLLFRPRR